MLIFVVPARPGQASDPFKWPIGLIGHTATFCVRSVWLVGFVAPFWPGWPRWPRRPGSHIKIGQTGIGLRPLPARALEANSAGRNYAARGARPSRQSLGCSKVVLE